MAERFWYLNRNGILPNTDGSAASGCGYNKLASDYGRATLTEQDLKRFNRPDVDPASIAELIKTHGMLVNGHKTQALEVSQLESRLKSVEPIPFVTIVCPPYWMDKLGVRKPHGLFEEFTPNPLDKYNFLYSHVVLARCLYDTTGFVNNIGMKVEPVYIVGDWAIRGVNHMKNSLPTKDDVEQKLDTFYKNTVDFFNTKMPGVQTDRFMHLPLIKDIMPFDVPPDPEGRKVYLADVACRIRRGEIPIDTTTSKVTLNLIEQGHNLSDQIKFLETNNWKNIVGTTEEKTRMVHVYQLWRNTVTSRQAEQSTPEKNLDDIESGYWDAILKYFEYTIYATAIKLKYPSAVNLFFDTKYPASGHAYNDAGLPTVFLDPRTYKLPTSDGVTLNPF